MNPAPSLVRRPWAALVLPLALVVAGCGGGAAPPVEAPPVPPAPGSDAGSAGSDHAGSEGEMNAGLVGVEAPRLSHEEFEELMKSNNDAMKKLQVAVQGQDAAQAVQWLEVLAENARRGHGSDPDKNKEKMAAYQALFGAQRATALGLAALVKSGAWTAMAPSMATLSRNCSQCHTQFRFSKAERQAMAREQAAAGVAPATVQPR